MNSPCTGVESLNLNEQRSPNAAPTYNVYLEFFSLSVLIFHPIGSGNSNQGQFQFWVELLDILIGFNTIDMKSSLLEISVQSLVWIWVTFPQPTILVFYNNAKRVEDGVETGPSRAWNYMVDLASA